MIQFTKEEISNLRKKTLNRPEVIEKLEKEIEEIFIEPLLIPEEGIGNWTLYYYCPECSVQLEVNRHSPYEHQCPICKKIYSGEPYDSAWWGFMHMDNYNGAFKLGILYLLTGKTAYGKKAVSILYEYARYYEGYQIHGDIPYNGPGKACAQTLDEAILLRTFAVTYDLVEELMDMDERESIKNHMLIPGADFLREHRNKQLHNHEVIINSAIAIIGILFNRRELLQFSIYEPYGLLYQLENGMLPYGVWFEGSFGYHFYALTSFFAYEKFAIHTEHSHISHPNYKKMMEVLIYYIQPNYQIPMINDTTYGHSLTSLDLYEFAYNQMRTPIMHALLVKVYENQKRDNLEALLYGVDKLEPFNLPLENYHTLVGETGHTVLRGSDNRFLLFKHDSYGGEHDHYDRLGISFLAYGKKVGRDFGTTGYGATLHYDYYKNTGSHNTVVIGEENQSPAACTLTRYEEKKGIIYVEAVCDWTKSYKLPDSFTMIQWKEENYKNVRMCRKIAWSGKWFVEMFLVEGVAEGLTTDWVMHLSGRRKKNKTEVTCKRFSEKKPFKYLHNVVKEQCGKQVVNCFVEEDVCTDLYSYIPEGELYVAEGPDNPSYTDVNYIVERQKTQTCLFLHVVEIYQGQKFIENVEFFVSEGPEKTVTVLINDLDGEHKIQYN